MSAFSYITASFSLINSMDLFKVAHPLSQFKVIHCCHITILSKYVYIIATNGAVNSKRSGAKHIK